MLRQSGRDSQGQDRVEGSEAGRPMWACGYLRVQAEDGSWLPRKWGAHGSRRAGGQFVGLPGSMEGVTPSH